MSIADVMYNSGWLHCFKWRHNLPKHVIEAEMADQNAEVCKILLLQTCVQEICKYFEQSSDPKNSVQHVFLHTLFLNLVGRKFKQKWRNISHQCN